MPNQSLVTMTYPEAVKTNFSNSFKKNIKNTKKKLVKYLLFKKIEYAGFLKSILIFFKFNPYEKTYLPTDNFFKRNNF